MRRCLPQVIVAAAMSFSLPALADGNGSRCPPGAWFCADAEVVVPAPAQRAPQAPQIPPQVVTPMEEPDALTQFAAVPGEPVPAEHHRHGATATSDGTGAAEKEKV